MKSRNASVIIWLSLFLVLIFIPQAQSNTQKEFKSVIKSSSHDQIDVIVWLKTSSSQKSLGHGKLSRVKNEQLLRSASAISQKDVLVMLTQLKKKKKISSYKPFWLINAIHVKGNKEALKEIVKAGNVDRITPNSKYKIPPVEDNSFGTLSSPSEWGIDKIQADKVQDDLGFDGSGIVIGHIDTGFDPAHPDLTGKLAGWVEFDENGDQVPGSTPHDTDTHGTHTAGTLVGGDTGGTRIGVAPGATVLSALALPYGSATFSQVIGAMQWVVDPDLDPLTDDGAKVVSMSFGAEGTNSDIADAIINMLALDAVPVASIGNCGPDCNGNPGNVPGAVGVGATDATDAIADFSSGGIVNWNYPPYVGDYIKPDVSAPGVDVLSSVPGGGYDTYSGTSMAAPHVAGAIALMRQANSSMDAEEIKLFDRLSVVDLGDEGKDTRYGYGRIDSYLGVTNVLNAAAITGTVSGDDNGNISPIQANVKILGADISKKSDPTTGNYSARLPAGTYDVKFSAFGYITQTVRVVLAADTTTTLDAVLHLAQIRTLQGTVFSKESGDPLSTTADIEFSIEDEPDLVQKSTLTDPETGMYSLEIPEGTYDVKVDAVAFDALNEVITVTSDTTIDFTLNTAPDILLVNGSYWYDESRYIEVLENLDISYKWVDKFEATINSKILDDFKNVIWFTYDNSYETVSQSEQTELADYMQRGGNLFITGQEIGFDLVELGMGETFYRNYLHAEYLSDWGETYNLFGAPGSIHEGINIVSYDWIADRILPATTDASGEIDDSAIHSLIFGDPETDELKFDGAIEASTDTNKLVYYSISFENVDTYFAREILMRKILNFFNFDIPEPVLKYAPLSYDLNSNSGRKFTKRMGIGNAGSGDLDYELSAIYCKADWNDQFIEQELGAPLKDSYFKKYENASDRGVSIQNTSPTNKNGSELVLNDADERDITIDLKSIKVEANNEYMLFRLTGYTDLLGSAGDLIEISIPIDEDRDRTTGYWNDGMDKVIYVDAEDGEITSAALYSSDGAYYDLMDSTQYNSTTKTLAIKIPVCMVNNYSEMNYYTYVFDYTRNKTDYAPDDTYYNAFSTHPDWLTLSQTYGDVPERSGDLVKLNINTTGMSPDSYDATIFIKNNANIERRIPLKLKVKR